MDKSLFRLAPLVALVGCGAPATSAAGSAALAGFQIGSEGLVTRPPATLPEARLPAGAFSGGAIAARLIATDEPFTTERTIGKRAIAGSTSWELEVDAGGGELLFVRRQPAGAGVALPESELQAAALARLASWGLGAPEILKVAQRRALMQSETDAGVGAPEVHSYKTFVWRGVNGVPVEGHRAVVSHGRDGVLRRMLVHWPPLAASGHKLRTRLSLAQIEERARAALRAAGETTGRARLAWKYSPALTPSGEAMLTLKVGARIAGSGGEHAGETREVDVSVDAEP
jgi:hypothetical protein